MRMFALLLILLSSSNLFAQPDTLWTRHFGGIGDEYGSGIIAREDGSFIVSGTTNSFGAGASDQYLLHLAANGDTIWARAIGTADEEWCVSLAVQTPLQYALAGYRFNAVRGHWQGLVNMVDTAGTVVAVADVIPTSNFEIYCLTACGNGSGGLLFAGHEQGQSFHSAYVNEIFPDSVGPSCVYDFGEATEIHSIARVADGGYILGGLLQTTFDGDPDFLLVRRGPTMCDTLWTRVIGGDGSDEINCVIQTSDGGFAFTGPTDSYGAGGDVVLFKTDSLGAVQWFRTFGGDEEDHGHIVIQTPDHGYFLAGHTASFGTGGDVIAIKTDSLGNQQWLRNWGGDGMDVAESAALTNDGGCILVGTTTSFGGGDADLWVLRISPELSVQNSNPAQIRDMALAQNYPNPFNGQTHISFDLSHPQNVTLKLFDLQGRFVQFLAEGPYSAGQHDFQFNAGHLPSGLYFYELSAGGFSDTKKMILLK